MTDAEATVTRLERRLERERRARETAEAIAEKGLRDLYERQTELELLEAIATAANLDVPLQEVLRLAIIRLCELTGWPVGHAWLAEPGGDGAPVLRSAGVWQLPEGDHLRRFAGTSAGLVFRAGMGMPGQVLASGAPIWLADLAEAPIFLRGEAAREASLRCACAFPVLTGQEVAAVLEFFGHEPKPPEERLLRLLAQVGTQLGRAVERWRAADRLRTAHATLDIAIDSMAQGLCLFDPGRRLVLTNRRYAELYDLPEEATQPGATAEAFLATHAARFEEGDAARRLAQLLDEASAETATALRLPLADGRIVAVGVNRTPEGGWVCTHTDVTEQHRAESRIAHLAHHDVLTNLPNRLKLRERLTQELALRRRSGGRVAVLCFDLDRFKVVNDTLGHAAGDLLLQRVAARMTGTLRETDMAARLGADEFAVIQHGAGQPDDAIALAERLIAEFALPFDLDGQQVVVGSSIGVAIAPEDGDDAETLLKHADLALWRTKVEGRGTYRFFEPEMDARMQARRALELDLRRALLRDELDVFYQPIVNLQARAVAGFEALLRWRHPQRGLVPPGEFVALAEETGLIVPIGEWVLRRACADAAGWPGAVKVAVNLSPAQFTGLGLVHAVADALRASGLPAQRLELEITETVMLADSDATLALLQELKALGVRIAMDDFGTGYSSLSYLRQFPFDRVKIDQSFTRALGQPNGDAIVRAITALCGTLGMKTTAEGVETADQLGRLAAMTCTDVQGYLFSRPQPASEVAALLARINADLAADVAPREALVGSAA